jgi:uncharacterized protein YecT (DUF1311 family)
MTRHLLFAATALFGTLTLGSQASAQTQSEMNADAQQELKTADAKLNKIYTELLGREDNAAGFAALLRDAQRGWLKYVELHLASKFPVAEGENARELYGSSYPLEFAAEKTKLIEQRIEMLEEM